MCPFPVVLRRTALVAGATIDCASVLCTSAGYWTTIGSNLVAVITSKKPSAEEKLHSALTQELRRRSGIEEDMTLDDMLKYNSQSRAHFVQMAGEFLSDVYWLQQVCSVPQEFPLEEGLVCLVHPSLYTSFDVCYHMLLPFSVSPVQHVLQDFSLHCVAEFPQELDTSGASQHFTAHIVASSCSGILGSATSSSFASCYAFGRGTD